MVYSRFITFLFFGVEMSKLSIEQYEMRLKAMKARHSQQNRKADLRRKIILGALLLEDAKSRENVATYVKKQVSMLTRRADIAAFAEFELPSPTLHTPVSAPTEQYQPAPQQPHAHYQGSAPHSPVSTHPHNYGGQS